MTDETQRATKRRVRQIAWAAAIILGLLQTWNSRHFMNVDGVSYLDIGDNYWRGNFATAINAYWSPLYSWLTGITLAIFNPSFQYESTVIHLLNYFIFLFALACFEFLLRGITIAPFNNNNAPDSAAQEVAVSPLPQWMIEAMGYALFLWSALTAITIGIVTPDMMVAAIAYLAAGILIRIRRDKATWLRFAQLGLVLGLGYLAKSPMFLFAFFFLAASAIAAGTLRRGVLGVVIAIVCFSLLALPFIAAISKKKGRWTFGDSGTLNYVWALNTSGNYLPEHPPRLIFPATEVYEFATPISGTYPLWYDPSYWNEGKAINITPHAQTSVLVNNLKAYYEILFNNLGFFFAVWLVAITASFRGRKTLKEIAAPYCLLLPALGALTIYAFVMVQSRYVIPFVVLLCLGLLTGIGAANIKTNRRWINGITVSLVFMLTFSTIVWTLRETRYDLTQGHDDDIRIAAGLKKAGIQAGEKAAFVGDRNSFYWARLAQIRVIAEIAEKDKFWTADEETKSRLFAKLREEGIHSLVTSTLPEAAIATGWQALEGTAYGVYQLPNSSDEPTE